MTLQYIPITYLFTIAFFAYSLLLFYFNHDGMIEKDEWHFFVSGWLLLPALVLAEYQLVARWNRDEKKSRPLITSLTMCNGLGIVSCLALLRVNYFKPIPGSLILFLFSLISLLLNLLIFAGLEIGWLRRTIDVLHRFTQRFGLALFLLLIFTLFGLFVTIFKPREMIILFQYRTHFNYACSVLLALLLDQYLSVRKTPVNIRRWNRIGGFFLIFVAPLLIFDVSFHAFQNHYEFFLAPVHDLLQGKSLLANINCQYGVGPIYFLAAIFKSPFFKPGLHHLYLIINLLIVINYLLFYWLMHCLVRPRWLAHLGMLTLLMIHQFGTSEISATFPSTGPLRFGLCPLLWVGLILEEKSATTKKFGQWLSATVVGIASVWSIETFFYVAATYACVIVLRLLLDWKDRRKMALTNILRGTAQAFLLILIFQGAMYLDVRHRSGQWPNWSYYLDGLKFYTPPEQNQTGVAQPAAVHQAQLMHRFRALYVLDNATLPIGAWDPWILLILVQAGSAGYVIWRVRCGEKKRRKPQLILIAAITVTGIAQFTYYLGRSHTDTLCYISVPVIFLFFLSAAKIFREASRLDPALVRATRILLIFGFILSISHGYLGLSRKFSGSICATILNSLTPLRHTQTPPLTALRQSLRETTIPAEGALADAIRLIAKYDHNDKHIPLLIDTNSTPQALRATAKVNAFPISYPIQDDIYYAFNMRLPESHIILQPGAILIVDPQNPEIGILQQDLLNQIITQWNLGVIEKTASGVEAWRLAGIKKHES